MHGRPRYPAKPQDDKATATKAAKLRALQSQFLNYHQNKIFDKEAIEVSAKLLEVNPEFYTAWNYRKLAVDHLLSQPGSDPEAIYAVELRLVESALLKNPKSYGAWHHRKWVLSKGHSSLDREERLLEKFQKADARNFHAWNYRRFVVNLKKISEEDELKYTTDMIERNFSNYSAWHNRSILLSNLLQTKAKGFVSKEKVLSEEYELVHQAIFTEPDDQSGWFYYLWLLEQTVANDSPFVISSWPATGSELILSAKSGSIVLPLTSCLSDEGNLPIILCFNQAVRGVNSATVTVTSALLENNDLLWRPLSRNKDESAQAWVALLNLSRMQIDYSLDYTIEVSLGCSRGIISLRGCQLSHAFQSKFEIRFQQHDSLNVEVPKAEAISWEESTFQKHEMEILELNNIPGFNQLQIDKDPIVSNWQLDILKNEIKLFRELLSFADCKIGRLTLARLLTALDTMVINSSALDSCHMAHTEEILSLYDDLMKFDPSHSRYYREQYSLAKLRQVCCTKENLMKYCWRYVNSTQSINAICLRLNNLSLARIGSFEKLLWVQMLDLSHNELQSVEGLEALQLLSCLNLSHNKIRSFTALDSIRHLKSLKVLNVAYNEICEHSIDTTRYLCSSPLSHTVGSDWKLGVSETDNTRVSRYWEAFFIFKDLNLIQLEVMGNEALDEDFRCFLFRILPSLKWLDGKSL